MEFFLIRHAHGKRLAHDFLWWIDGGLSKALGRDMKKLILAVMTVVILFPCSVWADGDGRYKIYTVQIEETKGKFMPLPVMIDTKTGRSWYMPSAERCWMPMPIFAKLPQYKDKNIKIDLGAAYSAEEINS